MKKYVRYLVSNGKYSSRAKDSRQRDCVGVYVFRMQSSFLYELPLRVTYTCNVVENNVGKVKNTSETL